MISQPSNEYEVLKTTKITHNHEKNVYKLLKDSNY